MSGLTRDPLYLACTRPAMKWGVPADGYYLNVGLTFVFGMIMGSPLWWGLFLVFHLPMQALANRDPNFFRELRLWFQTKGANLTGTLRALPDRSARKPGELAGAL